MAHVRWCGMRCKGERSVMDVGQRSLLVNVRGKRGVWLTCELKTETSSGDLPRYGCFFDQGRRDSAV